MKHDINFAGSPASILTLITGAITLGANQGFYAALTTANQVLHLLLFGYLLYAVTGKGKKNPNICNMWFNMD